MQLSRLALSRYPSHAPCDPLLKVADFGMSVKMPTSRTHVSGIHHGTLLYTAPEILISGNASKSSDVYSFGVLLWELFHGVPALQHVLESGHGASLASDVFR